VPKKTVELAVTMQDPDARVGTITHWVIWGIDPEPRKLPEETLPSSIVEGQHYFGPCPPAGDEPHRYVIRLYALSEPVELDSGASIDELLAAIDGTALAKAKLIGMYSRSAEETA
jgi:Raf kinase inhibitor-like YbhB/YbcL family protein